MARSRNIKPHLCVDDRLEACSPEAACLFMRLPMFCDKEGRMEYRPLMLKATAFPLRDWDADKLVSELVEAGKVTRYDCQGKQYLQIESWDDDQDPHYKEKDSKIPPPPDPTESDVEPTLIQHRPDVELSSQEDSRNVAGTSGQVRPLIPDSLTLIPDSLSSDDGRSSIDGRESNSTSSGESSETPKQPALIDGADPPKKPRTTPEEVFDAWNKIPGVRHHRKLTDSLRRRLVTRLKDPDWPWREAFARLPLKGNSWKPDLEYMTRSEDQVEGILNGKFDFLAKESEPSVQNGSKPIPKATRSREDFLRRQETNQPQEASA